MSYKIKEGVLYCDGKPVFALGASYYPSFLPCKYPVPPTGDRVGEMKKDLHLMKETGLNFFRTAALGETWRDEAGEVCVSTDFIDEMLREAETVGLAASVRLNGYSVNLSGSENCEFINHRGEPMEKQWSAFMHACLHHAGFLRDNADATRALAAHYDGFPAVVSYQIYNEPHYPFNGIFDYHPDAIAAYRRWLVANGKKTEEEAASYEPPRRRPADRRGIADWVLWRRFSMESMCRFLDATAEAAQEGSRGKDIYTCYTTSVAGNRQADMGITYFDDAPHLTTTTITTYTSVDGADYYAAAFVMAMAYSAAAVSGRRAWTAELDKRTAMPASKFRRETYEVIGAGHKGICYYAWRGDYPDPVTPEPDCCGFLHYDGRPTDSF